MGFFTFVNFNFFVVSSHIYADTFSSLNCARTECDYLRGKILFLGFVLGVLRGG